VIVIGGGLSGLLLALRLSKKDVPVTVIEKNPVFGGFNGRLDADTPLVCYSALGLEAHGSIAKLLGDSALWRSAPPVRMAVSDQLCFPDMRLALPGTLAEFHALLLQRYPSQKQGLQALCDGMTRVHDAIGDSAGLNGPLARAKAVGVLRSFASQCYRDYLRNHFDDPALRTILSVRAFSANNSALTMLAYLAKILIDGLYGLPGAGAALTDELMAQLRAAPSCTLHAATTVDEILFDEHARACGVRLADGRQLMGSVVANVDPGHVRSALVRDQRIQRTLDLALEPHAVALSAINLIFTLSPDLGRALAPYRGCARFFLSDDADPFSVLAARERGELDLRNSKMNMEFDRSGQARRVYVELDCAAGAADFAAMAGAEAQALAPVLASARARLRALQPDFDDGVVRVDILTPHSFAQLTNNRGGAASGFADQAAGARELDRAMASHGMLQIGQWSMYGSGLSQLETSALSAYGALRRQHLPGRAAAERS
jgi:phytoene dehydrogenase-like protein